MNYTQLKQEVRDFSHRTDLDTKMDIFTELSEAVINKDLRTLDMEKISSLTFSDAFTDLPVDYLEIRALSLDIAGARVPMQQFSPQQLDKLYSRTTGNSRAFAIHGGQIELRPAPSVADPRTGDLSYYARVPSLISNANNDILTNFPMVYLSAMMIQVYLFLQDSEEMASWVNAYNSQIEMANKSAGGGRYLTPSVRAA